MIFPVVLLFCTAALSLYLSFSTFYGKVFQPFSNDRDRLSSALYLLSSIFYALAIYAIVKSHILYGIFSSFLGLSIFFSGYFRQNYGNLS